MHTFALEGFVSVGSNKKQGAVCTYPIKSTLNPVSLKRHVSLGGSP